MFEDLGYFKEYYLDNKFLGTLNSEKDRETIGYFGRKSEIIEVLTILDNGFKVKPNTSVVTMLYPKCGKILKNIL